VTIVWDDFYLPKSPLAAGFALFNARVDYLKGAIQMRCHIDFGPNQIFGLATGIIDDARQNNTVVSNAINETSRY